MSAFDFFDLSPRDVRRAAGLSLALSLLSGCDDPMRPRVAPDVFKLALMMILEPGMTTQPILVQQAIGQPPVDIHGTVLAAPGVIAEAMVSGDFFQDMRPCSDRYVYFPQRPWTARCLNFAFTPQPRATYDIIISAPGRPTAHATTTVPGDFTIVSHTIQGTPPGTLRLDATWTRSLDVYRYVVALRGMPTDMPSCTPEILCHPRWFVVTEDTTISAVIDAKFLEASAEPYAFTVHAMNRDVYGYMMTGATSTFFPVPPAQNVRGGYGAVGAWVRRAVVTVDSVTLQRVAGGVRLTNGSSVDVDYVLWDENDGSGYQTSCPKSSVGCTRLPAGASVTAPNGAIRGFSGATRRIIFKFWRPNATQSESRQVLLTF